jgi:two-component system response regulator
MFTSSRELDDLHQCYQLGANGFVVKPADYQKFTEALGCLGRFWVAVNKLPPATGGQSEFLSPRQLATA